MSQDNQTHTDVDQEIDRTDGVTGDTAESDEAEGEDQESTEDPKLSRREKAALKAEKQTDEAKKYFKALGIDPTLLQEQTRKKQAETAYSSVATDDWNGDKEIFIEKYASLTESGMSPDKASEFAKEFAEINYQSNLQQSRTKAALPPQSVKHLADKTEYSKEELNKIQKSDPTMFNRIMDSVDYGEVRVR